MAAVSATVVGAGFGSVAALQTAATQVNRKGHGVQCFVTTNATMGHSSEIARRLPSSRGSSSYRDMYYPSQPDHFINLEEISMSLAGTESAEDVDAVMDKWRENGGERDCA